MTEVKKVLFDLTNKPAMPFFCQGLLIVTKQHPKSGRYPGIVTLTPVTKGTCCLGSVHLVCKRYLNPFFGEMHHRKCFKSRI